MRVVWLLALALSCAACFEIGGKRASGGKGDAGVGGEGGGALEHPRVPYEADALTAYLAEGHYTGFVHQRSPHPSAGPHGLMRVFFSDSLATSLAAGWPEHPAGAAAVVELFAADGATLIGWDVSVKIASDSEAGLGWYWYELIGPSGVAGEGPNYCSACHAGGLDFVYASLPFE
ncbi:MAG: hypothetical protein HY908_32740 [Myxococcales bacterium]|nr:hypothetical protein [Myxococcales bacterium]